MTISFNGSSSSSCNNIGVKFKINAAGHLICTYPDNTIEDLGLVVGLDGTNGSNFYPNDIGFDVPDGTYQPQEPIGWSYLSLANGTSKLYFKTSDVGVLPVTWNVVEFGKGDKGEQGASFTINSAGTVKPSTGLFDGYVFEDTSTGMVYIYDAPNIAWRGPFPFQGKQGVRGYFKIDLQAADLPPIAGLPEGYTVYDSTDEKLYYVEPNPAVPTQMQWSQGILFRGPKGESIKGDKGDTGNPGKDTHIIYNVIDTSYTNALLVVGTCPAGYVVTSIQVNVEVPYQFPVTDMKVRYGGTAQSELDTPDSVVLASYDDFDINSAHEYIVQGVHHEARQTDEILSCIFNESVNNSIMGKMVVVIELANQLPVTPISANI